MSPESPFLPPLRVGLKITFDIKDLILVYFKVFILSLSEPCMKINLDDIPESGLSVDLSEDGKELERLTPRLDFGIIPPVSAHLDIESSAERVYLAGTLKTALRLMCGRCLKPFDFHIDSNFTAFYVRGRAEEKEGELKGGETEVNHFEGNILDTDDVLLGQIALEAPIKPLCREDCLGFCQMCGSDLNLGPCSCQTTGKVDPRLARLKDFKVK